MILAFDIETIPNKDIIPLLPEPEVKLGNLKDPDKIAEKIAGAKSKQVEKMALNPLHGRVASFAVKQVDSTIKYVELLKTVDDVGEIELIQSVFSTISPDEVRLATWNGNGFDLPYIYKRAICLGINPANFGAPPLTTWTKRYSNDRHFDLMQIWSCGGFGDFEKLDNVTSIVLGKKKVDCDVTKIIDMLETETGRSKLKEYNLEDARLTAELAERFIGTICI